MVTEEDNNKVVFVNTSRHGNYNSYVTTDLLDKIQDCIDTIEQLRNSAVVLRDRNATLEKRVADLELIIESIPMFNTGD